MFCKKLFVKKIEKFFSNFFLKIIFWNFFLKNIFLKKEFCKKKIFFEKKLLQKKVDGMEVKWNGGEIREEGGVRM